MSIQRVVIVGAGAMGGMYAEHFARTGFDLSFVARGERAARLRDPGLTVNGTPLAAAVIDADDGPVQPADLVMFAVKDRQLGAAIEDAAVVIGPGTTMLSIMNGLDSESHIADRFGSERVLLCIALAMDAEKDGAAVAYRQAGKLAFGRPEGSADEVAVEVQEALDRAELAWESPTDMRHRVWWKFMVNTGINQASAILRQPYGAFQSEGPARSFMWALIEEVVAVADAEGIELGDEDFSAWEKVLANQPPEGKTSMLQDVEAGRPTEVESFAGSVVGLGHVHGIATPYNQTVAWLLG